MKFYFLLSRISFFGHKHGSFVVDRLEHASQVGAGYVFFSHITLF